MNEIRNDMHKNKSVLRRSAAAMLLFVIVALQTPAHSAEKSEAKAESAENRTEETLVPGPMMQEGAGTSAMPTAAPAGLVQVSGSTNSFTISAQHANVLSLLKLVFAQAHRQFVPDGSVTGDVTFALSGQKFEVVLDAVCKQAFLRYEIDRNGIYQFRRDEQALRNLIVKTQMINGVLQDQLRRMGYNVPAAAADGTLASGLGGGAVRRGGFGGGGNRGASSGLEPTNELNYGGALGSGRKLEASQNNVSNRMRTQRNVGQEATKPDAKSIVTDSSEHIGRGAVSPQGETAVGGLQGKEAKDAPASVYAVPPLSSNLATSQALAGTPNLENNAQYQMFLRQNNFVSINTQDKDVAVRDVLQEVGRQAGVSILIDPAVPRGADFVINGYITPRPLSEILNILAYKARLDWRWVNNNIFVTTTPQLQLYLRGTLLPPQAQNGNITILPAPTRGRSTPATDKKADSNAEPAAKEKPKDKNN